MVEILTQEAPAAVRDLADRGCNFALTADGKLDPKMKVNFMINLVPPGDFQVTSKPVLEVSNEVAEWVLEEKELSLQGHLLE
jgi:hypothetical protein